MSNDDQQLSDVPTRRYPSLDGLRALAILGVMALHYLVFAPVLPTPAGWFLHQLEMNGQYGVDLFFVLSGFLITSILLVTRDSPNYFGVFYARRVLRIFPLYYATLLVLLVIIPVAAPRLFGGPQTGAMSPAWFWFYLANWPIALHGWRVSPVAMSHFWTLAIEEQFYLLWPLVVYLVPRRRLVAVCTGLVVAGPLVRYLLRIRHTFALVGVATFTRLDGLAIGAIVAVWWMSSPELDRQRSWAWRCFWLSLGGLLIFWTWQGNFDLGYRAMLIGGLPLLNAFFGAAVAVALLRDRMDGRASWLAAPPLRFIGRYSYGLYVLHYPIQTALGHAGFTVPALIGSMHSTWLAEAMFVTVNATITMGAALLSWYALEQPILRLKSHFQYGRETRPAPAREVLGELPAISGSAPGS